MPGGTLHGDGADDGVAGHTIGEGSHTKARRHEGRRYDKKTRRRAIAPCGASRKRGGISRRHVSFRLPSSCHRVVSSSLSLLAGRDAKGRTQRRRKRKGAWHRFAHHAVLGRVHLPTQRKEVAFVFGRGFAFLLPLRTGRPRSSRLPSWLRVRFRAGWSPKPAAIIPPQAGRHSRQAAPSLRLSRPREKRLPSTPVPATLGSSDAYAARHSVNTGEPP